MITTEVIGEMFYTAPALLHPLVRKCHKPDFKIPDEIAKMLEDRNLIVDGEVPEHVKRCILRKITLDKSGAISMTL